MDKFKKSLRQFNRHPMRDLIGLLIAFWMITLIPLGVFLMGYDGMLVQQVSILLLFSMAVLLHKVGK